MTWIELAVSSWRLAVRSTRSSFVFRFSFFAPARGHARPDETGGSGRSFSDPSSFLSSVRTARSLGVRTRNSSAYSGRWEEPSAYPFDNTGLRRFRFAFPSFAYSFQYGGQIALDRFVGGFIRARRDCHNHIQPFKRAITLYGGSESSFHSIPPR